jgi:hypothetical protein
MALVPHVTNITAHVVTWNAQGIINALRAHIAASGALHIRDDVSIVNEGITVGFVDAAETHQVNMRKTATATIAMSVEPSGSITSPGTSAPVAPAGTSSDWSGNHQEPNWDVTPGTPAAGSKLWCVEVPDAFFLVITNTANTLHTTIMHAGRIADSFNSSSAPAAGQDGLGYMAGVPDNGSGTVNDWLGTSCPCSSLHWATGEWSDHINHLTAPTTTWAADTALVGYRPLTPSILVATDINGTATDGNYGPARYLRVSSTNASPMTLNNDTASNQGWMRYNDIVTTGCEHMIWNKTVTP